MEEKIIPYIEGDGVGPDIWKAAKLVFDEAVKVAYSGKKRVKWLKLLAGEEAYKETGSYLPEETIETLRRHGIGIKGPLTTPIGGGIRSLNVTLRQLLDLYACIRPVKYIPGVPSPLKTPEKVDMVVFRENTEDVYAGIEWPSGSFEAKKLLRFLEEEMRQRINPESGIGLKIITPYGTKRLMRMAIRWALERNRKSITIVHKGNIMKFTEGAFCQWAYEVAKEEFGERVILEEELQGETKEDKLIIKDRLADAMFQQVLLRPDEYDVIVTPNLNGDYLSEALAAMVGGVGMVAGANVGDRMALFEAIHGTAPKYAGKDMVNPTSLILSGAMMFEYLGWKEVSQLIHKAIERTIKDKIVTYDLARQMEGAKKVGTMGFAQAVVERLN
jgi:isocitrate dehydrogenase